MRNLRFFADAQNDIVGVGGFRRPDICRLLSVICRLNCHNPSASFLGTYPYTGEAWVCTDFIPSTQGRLGWYEFATCGVDKQTVIL